MRRSYLYSSLAAFVAVMLVLASMHAQQGPPPQNQPPGPAGSVVYQAIWDKGGGQWWMGWPPPPDRFTSPHTWNVEQTTGGSWHIVGYESAPKVWVGCGYPTFAQADAKAKALAASHPQGSYRVFGFCD